MSEPFSRNRAKENWEALKRVGGAGGRWIEAQQRARGPQKPGPWLAMLPASDTSSAMESLGPQIQTVPSHAQGSLRSLPAPAATPTPGVPEGEPQGPPIYIGQQTPSSGSPVPESTLPQASYSSGIFNMPGGRKLLTNMVGSQGEYTGSGFGGASPMARGATLFRSENRGQEAYRTLPNSDPSAPKPQMETLPPDATPRQKQDAIARYGAALRASAHALGPTDLQWGGGDYWKAQPNSVEEMVKAGVDPAAARATAKWGAMYGRKDDVPLGSRQADAAKDRRDMTAEQHIGEIVDAERNGQITGEEADRQIGIITKRYGSISPKTMSAEDQDRMKARNEMQKDVWTQYLSMRQVDPDGANKFLAGLERDFGMDFGRTLPGGQKRGDTQPEAAAPFPPNRVRRDGQTVASRQLPNGDMQIQARRPGESGSY